MAKFSTYDVQKASENIVNSLLHHGDIDVEVSCCKEVVRDVASVLTSYSILEEQISKEASDIIAQNGISKEYLFKTKKTLAEKNGIKIGEYALGYLVKQVISILMHSPYVDEVYSEDHVLQKHMRPYLGELLNNNKKQLKKIKKQLKHVDVGTAKWQIEYQRLKEKINARK